MKYPNFNEERKLWRKGHGFVVGIDEAGRGPLAGPVFAAAVLVFGNGIKDLSDVRDSKTLSFIKREEAYNKIINHPQIEWGIGKVSEKVIDKINILQATKLAIKRAVKNLEKKMENNVCPKTRDREFFVRQNFLIIDGNFGIDMDINQKSIIKADQKVFSCSAASIIAKVSRDRMMIRLSKKYPEYGFDRHKGYGTKLHRGNIKKCGFCDIHRKSFKVK